jgi:hypothetical protein
MLFAIIPWIPWIVCVFCVDEKDVERGHHIQRSKALESVPEDGL